jgi:type III secretion system low calcium response chaperone LcrH/SycD
MKISREKPEKWLKGRQAMEIEEKPSVAEMYSLGYHLYQAGRYADAEGCFRLLTTLDTQNAHHWIGLGAALQKQNKYSEAVDAYGAAVLFEDTQSNPYPHLHAAECLFALGDLSRAEKALASARKVSSKKSRYAALVKRIDVMKECWSSV